MVESAVARVRDAVTRLEADATLMDGAQFVARVAALDTLEQARLDGVPDAGLAVRIEALERRLADVDARWFAGLRAQIRAGDFEAVRACFARVAGQIGHEADDEPGYDELDLLLNGLLEGAVPPGEATVHDAEMVFYQPTPARVVLALVEHSDVTTDDMFIDLGSGLGQAAILLHLLTGTRVCGIEIEPGYVAYANACRHALGLDGVTFVQTDAREADLSGGTIFYLYTPFTGAVLRAVLVRLEAQARQRPIRMWTYGPVSAAVAREPWLQPVWVRGDGESCLAVFVSRSA